MCADDRFPETYLTSSGEREPVFFRHGIFRFHPTDELDPGADPADGHRPELGSRSSLPIDADFLVIDDGAEHGEFVAGVIEAMTGSRVTAIGVDDVFVPQSAILSSLRRADRGSRDLIVNMSFGTYRCDDTSPFDPGDPLHPLLQEMSEQLKSGNVAHYTVSAGNDETDQISWPAGFATSPRFALRDQVTSVGSIVGDEPSPRAPERSCFSNHGPWVEAWLPGEEVFVDSMGTWSGTSFAAPQAAAWIAAGVDPRGPAPAAPAPHDIAWSSAGGEAQGTTSCAEYPGSGPGDYTPRLPDLTYL